MADYGPARTSHNPYATPPRDEPSTAWTYESSSNRGRSVIVAEDAVFVRTDDELVALSTETGRQRWHRSREGWGRLEYVAGRVYEIGRDEIRALTPDGSVIWETARSDASPYLLERDGWLFSPTWGEVARIHADTGDIVATIDRDFVRPTTAGGSVYAGRHSATAYDIDGTEFSTRWSADSGSVPAEAYGPAAQNNGLLFRPERFRSDVDGHASQLSTYDATDGTQRATVELERTVQSPAADDSGVYASTAAVTASDIGSEGQFVALSVDGEERWSDDLDGSLCPPVSANGTVYVGPFSNDSAPLVAFDAETGDELWRRAVPGTTDLAIAGETLYVGTNGDVYALRA